MGEQLCYFHFTFLLAVNSKTVEYTPITVSFLTFRVSSLKEKSNLGLRQCSRTCLSQNQDFYGIFDQTNFRVSIFFHKLQKRFKYLN